MTIRTNQDLRRSLDEAQRERVFLLVDEVPAIGDRDLIELLCFEQEEPVGNA